MKINQNEIVKRTKSSTVRLQTLLTRFYAGIFRTTHQIFIQTHEQGHWYEIEIQVLKRSSLQVKVIACQKSYVLS